MRIPLEELWYRQPNNCWCEQHLQGTPVFPLQLLAHLHGKDSAWFWNKLYCSLWSFSEHLTSVNVVSWARPGFFYRRLPPSPSPLFLFLFPLFISASMPVLFHFCKGAHGWVSLKRARDIVDILKKEFLKINNKIWFDIQGWTLQYLNLRDGK